MWLLLLEIVSVTLLPVTGSNCDSTVCRTKGCYTLAAKMYRYLDTNVDPCEDMERFACGKWQRETFIPHGEISVSPLFTKGKTIDHQMAQLLKEDNKRDGLEAVKKVKTLYKSCLRQDLTGNDYGLQQTRELLQDILGGIPMVTPQWNESNFDLSRVLIRCLDLGCHPLFDLRITDEIHKKLQIQKPQLVLPHTEYYNPQRVLKYKEAMKEMIGAIGSVDPMSMTTSFELNEILTHLEFHQKYSQMLDWRNYIKTVMALPGIGIYDVTDDEKMDNGSPRFFKFLNDVVPNFPPRVIADYIGWRILVTLKSSRLLPRFHNLKHLRLPSDRGASRRVDRRTSRIDKCYQTIFNSDLEPPEIVLSRMYVDSNPDAVVVTIPEVKKMISRLKTDLKRRLRWLDVNTTRIAQEKIDHIKAYLGFDMKLLNSSFVDGQMEGIQISADDFFDNMIQMKKQAVRSSYRKLRTPYKLEKWHIAPTFVNAYYDYYNNAIFVPLAAVGAPVFSVDRPSYFNYGALGTILAHELIHAFSRSGRYIDKDGYYFTWNQLTDEEFKNRTECLVDHFANFSFRPYYSKDGKVGLSRAEGWLDETLSDNGALNTAYKSYKQSRVDNLIHQTLPGLNYTSDQLFFISAAQVWCALESAEDVKLSLADGRHPLARYRIIGMMQNSEEFSKAFHCTPDQPMNPAQKCVVW